MQFEEVISYCNKERIGLNQFLFLYCTYHNLEGLYEDYCNVNGYNSKAVPGVLLKDLLEREYIVRKGNDLYITEKFSDLFTTYKKVGDELFDKYPAFAVNTSNGVNMPLKGVDKYDISVKYFKAIKKSIKEHTEVLLDLEYAINVNMINFKIDKFVLGEMWKDFRKLRNGGTYNPIKVNNDF